MPNKYCKTNLYFLDCGCDWQSRMMGWSKAGRFKNVRHLVRGGRKIGNYWLGGNKEGEETYSGFCPNSDIYGPQDTYGSCGRVSRWQLNMDWSHQCVQHIHGIPLPNRNSSWLPCFISCNHNVMDQRCLPEPKSTLCMSLTWSGTITFQ